MRIQGVLLASVEEQRAGGDKAPIDPASIPIPEGDLPLTVNFSRDRPPIGRVTRLWLEDGRLMFEAEVP